MADKHEGYVSKAGGPKLATAPPPHDDAPTNGGTPMVTARVGQVAPDFEATAYASGAFQNITLSDYRGQWVVLCFYPGDFTFV